MNLRFPALAPKCACSGIGHKWPRPYNQKIKSYDEIGRITRPVKMLKYFEKELLAPGESKTFSFEITPAEHLAYPDSKGNMILEEGSFLVKAGDLEKRFWLK